MDMVNNVRFMIQIMNMWNLQNSKNTKDWKVKVMMITSEMRMLIR